MWLIGLINFITNFKQDHDIFCRYRFGIIEDLDRSQRQCTVLQDVFR
jgi:hypothetical protein